MRIGIAIEYTDIEQESRRLGILEDSVLEIYKEQGRNVDEIITRDERQRECIGSIIAKNYQAEMIELEEMEKWHTGDDSVDFLVAVGGELFFQRCAYYFKDSFLVGVNSDPQTNEGSLLYFDQNSLEESINEVLEDCFGFEEWTKITTLLNGEELEEAVSTVALSAVDRMQYCLRSGPFEEEQEASGILVVSGAGSGRGTRYRSAGLYLSTIRSDRYKEATQEFSKTERVLKTLTTEPRQGEDCPYKGLNLSLNERQAALLTYYSPQSSILSIDSIHRHKVKEGDVLMFRVSPTPLRVVILSK